ncbi:uncharacterized protein FPRO_01867 [Fusarium proliferatum ET1]|uniref:Uncharacterized protein n=1 Tax=Fusarium proliferatum (strain ET1) TaxID=1227346 RepID=A0A1L7V1U4_FUSPR|nr:uncharacterized protein FPRO_01867 [Fusarium proliferatum ET1]CZR33099.1 uncharacterized protein FPRO_01867 [Fusarium proliferatum ET1]
MLYTITFASLVLASSAFATVLNVNVYTNAKSANPGSQQDQMVLDDGKSDAPAWKRRDERHLVPLLPEARTGVIPADIEEGLIAALGPRFANEFIKVGIDSERGMDTSKAGGCGLKCAKTIIKAMPCIIAAGTCKCKAPILKCPVKLKELCNCVPCLPEKLQKIIDKINVCQSSTLDELSDSAREIDDSLDYGNFVSFETRDVNLLAYRGDLAKTTLEEARALAKGGYCPGQYCGGSGCCLGLCLFEDECFGEELELQSEESRHLEL